MAKIVVERIRITSIEKQAVEIVERKGLGHPDYIADSLAESFSVALSKYYIEHFGKILHHNVDKLEIIGGKTEPQFGGGKIIQPISVLFSGRATSEFDGKPIPVENIAIESAKTWIKNNIRCLDSSKLRFIFETKSGSANLSDAFGRGKIPSNDTSFGVGYAPLSATERLVLDVERIMNSKEFKDTFPFSGEDVKVMAVRMKKKIDLTIANAFIDKYITSVSDYFDKKAKVLDELSQKFGLPSDGLEVKMKLNGMDNKKRGKDGCYLTVTGTSAEHGDDGAVGRGNRVNGLITPARNMSLEAVAGKNPVNHVGKIYNVFAFKLAERLFGETKLPVFTRIVGRIGSPLDEPIALYIQITDKATADTKGQIKKVAEEELKDISKIRDDILESKRTLF